MGRLSSLSAPKLGAAAIGSALSKAQILSDRVEEVHMGCVLSAGLGQAPARQASRAAGIPDKTPCTTINKMCGSGMQTVMTAVDRIALGHVKIAVAGGMESMSNAPYLLPKMRVGKRFGHTQTLDHMVLDGLEDAYGNARLMGEFAEECANDYQFTRSEQDEFALKSLQRAHDSMKNGEFLGEIQCLTIEGREGKVDIDSDEQILSAKPEKIPYLKPAFGEGGTVTAANSSSISDGAAALVLASEDEANRLDMPRLARIVGQVSVAKHPSQFTTAPSLAAETLLAKLSWQPNWVNLWEVNEAFAVVCLAFMRDIGVSHDNLNVKGGACALGHPIGASGARILVTLIHTMQSLGVERGVAVICIGGGEATAMALERL